jgi:hypothetical protein
MNSRILICIFASSIFVGCATRPIENFSVNEVVGMSAAGRDEFRKFSWVKSPLVSIPGIRDVLDIADPLPQGKWQLSAEKSDGATNVNYFLTFRLVGGYRTGGWAFVKEAYDRDGKRFVVRDLAKDVDGSLVYEVYGLTLDHDYLESARQAGKELKLFGRREIRFSVPTNVVDGFLNKVDQTFRQ